MMDNIDNGEGASLNIEDENKELKRRARQQAQMIAALVERLGGPVRLEKDELGKEYHLEIVENPTDFSCTLTVQPRGGQPEPPPPPETAPE
jgi:hypothetical protein